MSTIRERVLAGLGGCCAWCQTTDAPMEIDHIDGGGNVHRRDIKIKLHVWLWRTYQRSHVWPTGFMLLCKPCHDRKSGRNPMPPREGATAITVSIQNDLAEQARVLAASPEYRGKVSMVYEAALIAMLEGKATVSAMDSVHQHLSKLQATLAQKLQIIEDRLSALEVLAQHEHTHNQTTTQMLRQELDTVQRQQTTLVDAFDRFRKQPQSSGLLGKFLPH